MEKKSLVFGDLHFPSHLGKLLQEKTPYKIHIIGSAKIIKSKSLALFSSGKCPGDLLMKSYDFAQMLRKHNVSVISGFHSPIEKQYLNILLNGLQPVIICPAKSIQNMRIPREYKRSLKLGRLLIMSPFSVDIKRSTIKTCLQRNLFTGALAHKIFVVHAPTGSKTEKLIKSLLKWNKEMYTFNHEQNNNLIHLGVKPIEFKDSESWIQNNGFANQTHSDIFTSSRIRETEQPYFSFI